MNLRLLEKLGTCRRVFLVGAGGGFDFLSGLPLYLWLRSRGQEAVLGSLSFSPLGVGPTDYLRVRAGGGEGYFPEQYLCDWFALRGLDVPVYCFAPTGAQNLLLMYADLLREVDCDALVLVDGGTDSLMRGDEPGLGTPAEDIPHLAAASRLDVPVKLLVNLGFGVDTFHDVCHHYVLEAVADLTAQGGFLGAFSLLPGMPEFDLLAHATEFIHERMPGMESIVASSVVAAGQGRFGDYHPTGRTKGSTLYLNPLMAMYWGFELEAVARRCLYLDYMLDTYTRWDVNRALSNFLYTVKPREWRDMPM